MAGACLLFVVLVMTSLYCYVARRKKLARATMTTVSTSPIGQVVLNDPTAMTSMTTAIGTSHELSIPVYLEYRFGVEVRSEAVIARGGGGVISMACILSPRLSKRAKN